VTAALPVNDSANILRYDVVSCQCAELTDFSVLLNVLQAALASSQRT
jgi:hypothetical protein